MADKGKFFIGIDLGWKEKKTTGICVLEGDPSTDSGQEKIILQKDVFGKNVLKAINPYLEETKVIVVDAPLTLGRGKGKMRLFEKFLSTKNFRKEKISLIPPAVMAKLSESAKDLSDGLQRKGFVLGENLIETSTFLIKRIVKEDFINGVDKLNTENEESSFICAKVAFLHSNNQTGYVGYKDGFLFLPELAFWKKEWQEKFYREWVERDRLRYRYLSSNIFQK